MKHALFVAPFGELADARALAEVARRAEVRGWEGFFLWDHIQWKAGLAVGDPWMCLTAIAMATERMRIGLLVTPLTRRRPQELARQSTTLDRLSGGRLVFGVGLGHDRMGELSSFGEIVDPVVQARRLDEALDVITQLWTGEEVNHQGPHHTVRGVTFTPRPVQQPRIPVWVAGRTANAAPTRRAARWDGYFPIDLSVEQVSGEMERIDAIRGSLDGFDLVVTQPPGTDPGPWERIGVTWFLAGAGDAATVADVEAIVDAGPPS
jgi:alkanesulfonate monooxygenase SsuD/methylene tetrahydromethanopterin reductase-like flavin-dependent oxidoreductase (luciferase family)